MIKLKNITQEDYRSFLNTQAKVDFLQSTFSGNKLKDDGWTIEYVQGIENNEIKVVAMICICPLLKVFNYAYIPRGFFIDYQNVKLLKSFSIALKQKLKKQKVIYAEIDPDIIYKQRDKNGNIIKGGINNQLIIDNLKAAQFIQMPLTKGYDISKQCRWMSVIDLRQKDKDAIFSEFSTQTRNDIRNAQKYGVKVRELNVNELNILDKMEQDAGERHHFEAKPVSYYQSMYRHYGQKHMKTLYAYLDLDFYSNTVIEERKKSEAEIELLESFLKEVPGSKKKQRRLKATKEYYEGLIRKESKLQSLKEKFGHELPLAASMFVKYKNVVTYLFSGSDYNYHQYRGSYAIQWNMIQEAIEEGYDYYNMYGISGYFEKGQDGFGVFDFKRGFNAQVVELIGRYHLICYPVLYKFHKLIHKNI